MPENNEVVPQKKYDYDDTLRISYEGDQIYINGEKSTLNLNSTIGDIIAAQQAEENQLSNNDYFTNAMDFISKRAQDDIEIMQTWFGSLPTFDFDQNTAEDNDQSLPDAELEPQNTTVDNEELSWDRKRDIFEHRFNKTYAECNDVVEIPWNATNLQIQEIQETQEECEVK